MTPKILTKVLEELNKEKPDISYVKGMVETLLALGENEAQKNQDKYLVADGTGKVRVTTPEKEIKRAEEDIMTDQAAILDAQARASIDAIRALSEKSLEQ